MLQMLWKGQRAVLIFSVVIGGIFLVAGVPMMLFAPHLNPRMTAVPLIEALKLVAAVFIGLLVLGTIINVAGSLLIFVSRLIRQKD